MAPICLAPFLIAGALLTLHPNASHTTDRDAAYVEIQSCRDGLGAHGLASTADFYAGGIQYGVSFAVSDAVTVTLQPFVGGSVTTRTERQLPLGAQFETGVNAIVSYGGWSIGAKWLHASNAGLKSPNIGVDWLGVFVGRQF